MGLAFKELTDQWGIWTCINIYNSTGSAEMNICVWCSGNRRKRDQNFLEFLDKRGGEMGIWAGHWRKCRNLSKGGEYSRGKDPEAWPHWCSTGWIREGSHARRGRMGLELVTYGWLEDSDARLKALDTILQVLGDPVDFSAEEWPDGLTWLGMLVHMSHLSD